MMNKLPTAMSSPPRPARAAWLAILALAAVASLVAPARPALADAFTSQKELLPPPKSPQDEPPLPKLSQADKTALMKLARQALEYSAESGKRYEPTDVPAALAAMDCVAYVTGRQAGHLIDSIGGEGESLVANITHAAARVAANTDLGRDKAERLASIRQSTIELNICGPGQRLEWKGNTLDAIMNSLSLGVHGLAVRLEVTVRGDGRNPARVDRKTIAFKDSVGPTRGYTPEDVVHRLLEKAGWVPTQASTFKDKVTFFRFRTIHLLERPAPPGYLELYRCSELVKLGEVGRERLNMLIDLIGSFMLYRQLNSGLFSYDYSAPDNRYTGGDNPVRQAAAVWAVARLASVTGEAGYELAALKAIDAATMKPLNAGQTAACVSYPFDNNRPTLGATALMVCALADLPNNKALASLRDKLAAGLLAQQQENGSFKLYYADRPEDSNKFYYPGECLLALMKLHLQTGEKKYLAAVEKSFAYYHELFQTEPNRSFVPWQSQAWALAYRVTRNRQYADFIFQMADYMIGFQTLDPDKVEPDMLGGFINEKGFAGAGTTAFIEGMVPAYTLAAELNDARRAEQYRRSLVYGARFIDQLIFKQADAFYCLSKKDVVGGVKMSPMDHTLRIDNCQHAVLALVGIREALFPAPATQRK